MWFVAGALLLVLQPAVAFAAQAITKDVCLGCHSTEGLQKLRNGKPVSLQVQQEPFEKSVHGVFECTACHSDATQIPHKAELKPVECVTCHAATVQDYNGSIHGKARSQGFTEPATCTSCHGDIHRITSHADPVSPVSPKNVARTCAICHANAQLAEKFRIPVVRPVESYSQSVHARAVAAGKNGAVCTDCHGAHTIRPAIDPASQISPAHVPETCGQCHTNVLAAFRDSIHGEAFARGIRDAPTCTDCHGEHRILARTEPRSPIFAANIPSETCGRCHRDTRLSERFGLPSNQVPAFQDSFHGLALRAGQLTAANCASCHGVHDIRPSSDPRSHVNAANLAQTCGKCHPGAGKRFQLGPVHILSSSLNVPVLFWIRAVYLAVIILTIGFMLLHNGIDLVHKSRHPARELEVAGDDHRPERMPRALRWQHGLIMVTFPLLAYTGFALTYPESWWAAPLLHWEASLGLRGFLHRAAAVILLVSLIWHWVAISLSATRRQRLKKQMLRWKDLRDAGHMMAYNLGLRAELPHMGEFNYADKIEYWALMWGMVIMSVTGVLLWFENTTLSYLPKITTDIATAFHFYEAVLATLAIVVWHFYWVIFDPEVYPMDMTWWTGRSPAVREQERAAGTDAPKRAANPHDSNA